MARHLPRFISGNPNVVVRNMPGASSNLAALHMFNVAARDGSVLGMFQRFSFFGCKHAPHLGDKLW